MGVDHRPDVTPSGISIPDLGDADVLRGLGHQPDKIGIPGEPPFRRGIHPSMYRGRLWTMRQYAGFGSATATNQRFRLLLERGQMGLSIAFDLPTLKPGRYTLTITVNDLNAKTTVSREGIFRVPEK